uniref:Uncharacterized protein n=1 Tax=Romanomermis culicivorax TaxID=13658 RepID=A0A915KL64_ROMCU
MEPMIIDQDSSRLSYNYCPECPEVIDSKLLLLLHFMAKHYIKYAEIRKRGLPAMRNEIPGFTGSKLEIILQEELAVVEAKSSDEILEA